MRGEWAWQPEARDRVSIPRADRFGGTRALRWMPGRDASIQVHAKSRRNIARSEILKSSVKKDRRVDRPSGAEARLSLGHGMSRLKPRPTKLIKMDSKKMNSGLCSLQGLSITLALAAMLTFSGPRLNAQQQ